jgi:hypothetical protein
LSFLRGYALEATGPTVVVTVHPSGLLSGLPVHAFLARARPYLLGLLAKIGFKWSTVRDKTVTKWSTVRVDPMVQYTLYWRHGCDEDVPGTQAR